MRPLRRWHLIHKACGEKVPGVEVAVAIIPLGIEGIIQDCGAVLADDIQSMGPRVSELAGQSMPRPELEARLKGIVVRSSRAIHLQNVSEIGEIAVLVDVGYDVQFSSLAANVA